MPTSSQPECQWSDDEKASWSRLAPASCHLLALSALCGSIIHHSDQRDLDKGQRDAFDSTERAATLAAHPSSASQGRDQAQDPLKFLDRAQCQVSGFLDRAKGKEIHTVHLNPEPGAKPGVRCWDQPGLGLTSWPLLQPHLLGERVTSLSFDFLIRLSSGELNSALLLTTGSKSDLNLPLPTLTSCSFATTSQVLGSQVLYHHG